VSDAWCSSPARYFTPFSPDIQVPQEVPEEIQARSSIESKGESSLRGHLKAESDEQGGSQTYVPPGATEQLARTSPARPTMTSMIGNTACRTVVGTVAGAAVMAMNCPGLNAEGPTRGRGRTRFGEGNH
jgi:hypothetical protein